jgi:hypothetical protein
MTRLAEMLRTNRPRKTSFRARLPTNLPGISYTARGPVWHRHDGSLRQPVAPREAKAAALAAVYKAARKETESFEPEAVFHAEQAVNVALADWQPHEDSPLEIRARLSLDLAIEDAAKIERFTESRRAARLEEALTEDHINFMREVVLVNEDTARLWWIHRNLTGDDPATSWQVFRDAVRPLIRIDDENDPVTKLARALLLLNDYVNEDREQRLETLAIFAAFVADKVGQGEVAKTLANLRQPAAPGQPEANGTAPAAGRGTEANIG